jgi:hypothetical protein
MSGKATRSDNQSDPQPDRRRSKDSSRRANTSIIAYYKAQRRGFRSSADLDEWLSSERAAESGTSTETGSSEGSRTKTKGDRDAKTQ